MATPQAYLLVDDSVQDKRYSQKIELVKRQYSGNAHGLVKGIGMVNISGPRSKVIEWSASAPQVATATWLVLDWQADLLQNGQLVKLKELSFKVRLFLVVAPDGHKEWVITNHPGPLSTNFVQNENAVRWQIEQMYHELEQLTGTEKCECRKQRSQRNHLACRYQTWLAIQVIATKLNTTMYSLFSDYLRNELRQPRIPALVRP